MNPSNAMPHDEGNNDSAEVFAPGPAALSDEWMRYLPEELRESFVKAQVRSRLNALNDDTPLSQDLASIYLDVSDATLKRMRASGKGPQYIQGMSEEGAKSRNQKVLYTVGALKDWISKNRTDSTGHAAIRRGLMFQSLSDLLTPEPWWLDRNNFLVGHAYQVPIIEDGWKLVWLDALEAIEFNFEAKEHRKKYSSLIQKNLKNKLDHLISLDEKYTLYREIDCR